MANDFCLQTELIIVSKLYRQERMNSNNYILPNAACDLGLNYVCLNEFKKAKYWLNAARSDYSGKRLFQQTSH